MSYDFMFIKVENIKMYENSLRVSLDVKQEVVHIIA